MKILFVQPDQKHAVGYRHITFIEPLALETIAACVPQHEVNILDMRVDPDLEKVLNSFQPDIIGTTAYTIDVYRALQILRKAKELNGDILTVVGGHHATMVPEDFRKNFVDVIVIGEGEFTLQELVSAYESKKDFEKIRGICFRRDGKWIFNSPRPLIEDLDKTPIPLRSLTKEYHSQYHWFSWAPCFLVETSRGCPYRCNFCSTWKVYQGRYRTRSPKRVVEEIESIREDYVVFADDNFLQDANRARRIYELLKARKIRKIFEIQGRADTIAKNPDLIEKWVKIGLKEVAIGFESFRDSDLERFNKKSSIQVNEQAIDVLHKNGVRVFGQFIVDVDYTEEDFGSLAEYVEKLGIAYCAFSVITPLPGTDFYKQKHHELVTDDYELFDVTFPVLPTALPREEFLKSLLTYIEEFISLPKI